MSEYFFDEDHGIAYKVEPILTSVVHAGGTDNPEQILVYTDVKVTNVRKEKIRRTLSELYPMKQYEPETARKDFADKLLSRFISGARKITEQEYASINARYEI